MRIGVHGRSMTSSLAPQVADLLKRMEAHGLTPLLDEDITAWLRANNQEVTAGALTRTAGRLKDIDMVMKLVTAPSWIRWPWWGALAFRCWASTWAAWASSRTSL